MARIADPADSSSAHRFILLWCHQNMEMIRHQHIGIYRTITLSGVLFKPLKKELVIIFSVETGLPAIIALNDVHGCTNAVGAWCTGTANMVGNIG
jgi:hypothetical protein